MMLLINKICFYFEQLSQVAVRKNETLTAYTLKGDWSVDIRTSLYGLCELLKSNNCHSYLDLEVDTERLSIDEFLSQFSPEKTNSNTVDWSLTLRKAELVQNISNVSLEYQLYLFCSIESFHYHSGNSLGLENPFKTSPINQDKPVVMYVYKLDCNHQFGGSHLAIIPIDGQLPLDFCKNIIELPDETRLKKNIHIIASDNVKIRPINFDVSWGNFSGSTAKAYRIAYAKTLFACLSKHFFSEEKIVLHGVKHLEVSLLPTANNITAEQLLQLKEAVKWCYGEDESETKLQLLADRLSLDIPEGGSLLKHGIDHIKIALDQARSKYCFVIAERNNDYRKELKDVYVDIQQFSSKYADKSTEISSGLLKDLLSIAFIFTVGTFAKNAIMGDLLRSHGAEVFFNVVGIYLLLSFLIRYMNAISSLSQHERLLIAWSIKLRSHVPEAEVSDLIKGNLESPKDHFNLTVLFVGLMHLFLAFISFESIDVFHWLGF